MRMTTILPRVTNAACETADVFIIEKQVVIQSTRSSVLFQGTNTEQRGDKETRGEENNIHCKDNFIGNKGKLRLPL